MNSVYTAVGSPNIAFIKYWGQRNEEQVLPNNSSISMTLRGVSEPLVTVTSVAFSSRLSEDVFYVDGKLESDPKGAKRVANILREYAHTNEKLIMVSYNSFPAATGLASSASGIATLVYAASKALELNLNLKQLSMIARVGSGSACRGIYGGFVRWNKGEIEDGSDSFAEQVFDENHWPELNDLIVIVSALPKKVSSSEGHKRTVETSSLYSARPEFAEQGIRTVEEALRQRDIHSLTTAIMRDSDNMHATAETSWPPIIYRNEDSRKIMDYIQEYNEIEGHSVVGYSFDAGPNAHLITTDTFKGAIISELKEKGFKNIIEAKSGPGPKILNADYDLIDESTLEPRVIDPNSYFADIQKRLWL